MEKINIAEILKDSPSGIKLYSPIFGDVYLDEFRPHLAVVVRTSDKQREEFLYDGRFGINGECMLFPSKDNRDWRTFQRPFKDGDILVNVLTRQPFIFKKLNNSSGCYSYCGIDSFGLFQLGSNNWASVKTLGFPTEEEKEKLFNAIKENGYRWNAEKKELERLVVPKFKVGDRIRHKLTGTIYKVLFVLSNGCGGGVYDVAITNEIGKSIDVTEQDNYELVPNKFNIDTLKAFESRVLVRDKNIDEWRGQFYSHYYESKRSDKPYICIGVEGLCEYKQCIPYEGNEHLLGTTSDCSEYYKTWE